jgi:prephenate dehydrogenase
VTRSVVGIFGIGLIGGSIGLRARRNGAYVIGSDCDLVALETARTLGAIDAVAEGEELHRSADVLVIATHLEATLDELTRLAQEPDLPLALVLDVSSVKEPVVRAARRLKNFVATHPMAGSERSGVSAAHAGLFDDCSWAFVPTGDGALDARAEAFIRSCGGMPVAIEAEAHDRMVALTSHIPQIMASRYADLLRTWEPNARQLCGPVARELLRIADMNPAMWRDILTANAHNIEPPLRRLAYELEKR